MRRLSRRALPVVLMLAIAPTAVVAQSFVCHAIRRGETASQAAQRLTGNGRNKYQPWFQIMAASGRFVPKSQYDRIRADWQACVIPRGSRSRKTTLAVAAKATAPAESAAVAIPAATSISAAAPTAAALETSAGAATLETTEIVDEPVLEVSSTLATVGATGNRSIDLTVIWLGAAVAVPWLGWRIIDDVLARRRRATLVMRHFTDRFVREFERPLIQHYAAEHPVRVRFRSSPFGRRFDVLLAPGTGRRYPNLTDHKQNVEYDVLRVLHALADDSFVNGPLHAQAEWVVVPFQRKSGPTHRV